MLESVCVCMYSRTALFQTPLGQPEVSLIKGGVLISGVPFCVVLATNSVLIMGDVHISKVSKWRGSTVLVSFMHKCSAQKSRQLDPFLKA